MTRLFRKQLIIAIVPVLLLAALSSWWTTRSSEDFLVGQLRSELATESTLHAAGVEAFLNERIAELSTMAASPVMQRNNLPEVQPYLAAERARLAPTIEGLYHNDISTGDVQGATGEPFNVADRYYFPDVQAGKLVITKIDASRATGASIVLIITPVRDPQQKHIAALGGSVRVDTLLARVSALVPEDVGFATLIDGSGRMLTPANSTAQREVLAQWLADGAPGDLRVGDIEYLADQAAVPRTDWHLVIAKRRELAVAPAAQLRRLSLAVSILVLFVAFLIAYYFTARLLSPVAQLVEAHHRLRQGEWHVRLSDLPADELGDLGRAFNQTAQQISERQAAQRDAEVKLRESEARFRMLSESTHDAVYLHDAQGYILDVNTAGCLQLGYTRDELLKMKVSDFVASLTDAEVTAILDSMVQQRKREHRREGVHRRKDGVKFPVDISVVPLSTGDGWRFLASARDISERRKAEEKIAKFFRLAEDMLCIADAQGIFRQLSPAFEQVLGFRPDEMLGRPFIDFVHPEDREATTREGRKVFEGGGGVIFENRYRCKDGSYKWLEWRPFRELDEGMIYAIARDVTDRHRLARLMRQTSETARIGGWELDFLTGELFWTYETYRLHDTTPDEYRPDVQSAIEFYAPESRPIIRAAIEKAQSDGTPWSLELELITAKGRRIWAHALGRVDIENGRPLRAYGSFQDITERHAAEEERRRIDDQLREMQRVESIGILAGGIAHDFNNLLTGVLGFTRLAAAEADANCQETIRGHLQQIEECSLRAADLCKQLLAYAGRGQHVTETIDVSELVRETSNLVQSILGGNVNLELDLDRQLPLVEGDPTQFRQVVMNLVHNAFDALEGQPGEIRVRTGLRHFSAPTLATAKVRADLPAGDYVFLEVSDTGIGMTPETANRIFDPFFTTKFAGRGLGLAAVQGIVRSHDGAVLVQSERGKGTTFTVVLPPAEDPEMIMPGGRKKMPADEIRCASGGTILLLDDEAAVLSLARTALERGGYRVVTAASGRDGLALYQEHRGDIVAALVDMTMPEMSGLEVLRTLRAADADLPLLLMSGYTETRLDEITAELRLAGFVEKPFKLSELLSAVQTAIATPVT